MRGKKYPLNKRNLIQYVNRTQFTVSVKVRPQFSVYTFLLGKEFLRDYCISFAAISSDLSAYKMGLGESTEVEDDPKFIGYTKSTAMLSPSITILLLSTIMLIITI